MKKLRLFVYGNEDKYSVLDSVLFAAEVVKKDKNTALEYIDAAVKTVLTSSQEFGFSGNLWKCFISYLIINDENPYSLSLEMKSLGESPAAAVAYSDLHKLYDLYNYDFSALEAELGEQFFSCFENSDFFDEKIGGKRLMGRTVSAFSSVLDACSDKEKFALEVENFYRKNGVGIFAFAKAFRLGNSGENLDIIPIFDTRKVSFDDLWGYEYQKEQIISNTLSFVKRSTANNVLLYGDAGTGKSTMIKAVLNEYSAQGLRMVEVYKHQFDKLVDLIGRMKTRNYSFIIYMDDLSFEDFEIEYKYLKAVIEGGLEERPKNVIIYATSNRRHLVKETWKDRNDFDSELHKSDTMSEKLSLADRFGMSIGFSKPVQKDYFEIVKHLAAKNGIDMDEKALLDGANQWELMHSGRCGRTAQQYIDYLLSSGIGGDESEK